MTFDYHHSPSLETNLPSGVYENNQNKPVTSQSRKETFRNVVIKILQPLSNKKSQKKLEIKNKRRLCRR